MPQTETSTSLTLLQRVGEFDPDAWERLARLYSPLVYRWCRRKGIQDSDAADVMQEVFRAVASGIAAFSAADPRGKFRAWLWGITRHKLADHFQAVANRPEAQGGSAMWDPAFEVEGSETDDDPAFNTDAALVHRALELLEGEFEESTWQAFWRMVAGHRAADIAADLGMSTKAVRQAKYRVVEVPWFGCALRCASDKAAGYAGRFKRWACKFANATNDGST